MVNKLKYIILSIATVLLCQTIVFAQNNYSSEDEMKKAAEKFFAEKKYSEALPLFSQLVSLYPKDPNYNYKFGASALFAKSDKEEGLSFLKFAVTKPDVNAEAYYFLGKAHQLNYRFDEAIEQYNKFKSLTKPKDHKKYEIDRELEMCRNGKNLLKLVSDIIVLEKKKVKEADAFRSYNIPDIGGKLIVKPDEFRTDYEKKNNLNTVMFLPDNAVKLYYSSFSDKDQTGKDIYVVDKLESGEWSKPIKLPTSINTPYDEEFPFMHPDGKTLFFSSKGHSSMGGYDIFKSFYDERTKTWSEPQNLDFAINSPDDDYLFVTDSQQKVAYFASRRESVNDDIYIYKIEIERVPLQEAFIKGVFAAEKTKNAKITVESIYDNVIIGEFTTDPKTGEYSIQLPNTGKYKFIVEADKSSIIHQGIVELNNQDPLTALRQEMKIQGEGDNEKLLIKNILSADKKADEPANIEIIRSRAKLEVNKDRVKREAPTVVAKEPKASDGSKLILSDTKKAQPDETEKTATAETPATADKSSRESTIKSTKDELQLATLQAKRNQQLANELFAESSAALQIAQERDRLAKDEIEQAQALEKLDKTNPSDERKKEIDQLRSDAQRHQLEAAAAFDLARELDHEAKNYQEDADVAEHYAEQLQDAIKRNADPSIFAELRSVKDSLDNVHQTKLRDGKGDTYAFTQERYATKKVELDNLKASNERKEKAVKSKESELSDLRISAANESNKKKKKELNDNAFALSENLNKEKEELKQAKNKENVVEHEFRMIEKELEIVQEVMQQVSKDGSAQRKITEKEIAALEAKLESFSKTAEEDLQAVDLAQLPPAKEVSTSSQTTQSTPATKVDTEKSATPKSEITTQTKTTPKQKAPITFDDLESKSEVQSYDVDELIDSKSGKREEAKRELVQQLDEEIAELKSTDVPAKLSGLKHADEYFERFKTAEKIDNETERYSAKAQVLDSWATKVENESQGYGIKAKEEKKKTKKEEYISKSQGLATDAKQIRTEANKSYSLVNKMSIRENPDEYLDAMADFTSEAKSQSVPALLSAAYHKEFTKDFADAADINDDFLRAFRTLNINQSWLSEIQAETMQLEERLETEENPAAQKILIARIASLQTIANLKQNEISKTIVELRQLAGSGNVASQPAAKGSIDSKIQVLTKDAETLFIQAMQKVDASETASNDTEAQQLLAEADEILGRAALKVKEAQMLSTKKSSFLSTAESSVSIRAATKEEAEAKAAKAEEIAEEMRATSTPVRAPIYVSPSAGTSTSPTSSDTKPKASGTTQTAATPVNVSEQAKQNYDAQVAKVEKLESEIKALQKQADNQSDPAAKAALLEETKMLKDLAVKTRRDAAISFEVIEAARKAEATVIAMKATDERESGKRFKTANVLYNEITDDLVQAISLREQANKSTDEAEKAKLLLQADVLIEAAKKKQADAEIVYRVATEMQRAESSVTASNKAAYQSPIEGLSVPTKKLTTEQIADLSLTDEFQTYDQFSSEFKTLIKQADVQYNNSAQLSAEAFKLINESKKLMIRAAEVTNVVERDKLISEANKLDKQAQDKLREAQNTKSIADEIAQNAIDRRTQGQEFLSSLPKEIRESIIVYESMELEKTQQLTAQTTTPTQSPITPKPDTKPDSKPDTKTPVTTTPTSPKTPISPTTVATKSGTPITVTQSGAFSVNASSPKVSQDVSSIPIDPVLPSGIVYKVQVGAFTKPLNKNLYAQFSPVTGERANDIGVIRYTAGIFNSFAAANEARKQISTMGYSDAFVVAYIDGKRYPLYEARNLERKGSKVADAAEIKQSLQTAGIINGQSGTTSTTPSTAASTTASLPANVSDISNTEGLFYTVQVGVYVKPVGPERIFNIEPLIVKVAPNGYYRYNTGFFQDRKLAENLKTQVVTKGVKDAFVVAYYNGERIDLQQAQKLIDQYGATIFAKSGGAQIATAKAMEGIIFKVQVGAYRGQMPKADADKVADLSNLPIDIMSQENGLTSYSIGNYRDYKQAEQMKNKLSNAGVKDAFVIAYKDGVKINTLEAIKLINQQ